jgi:hypothetical protein
MRKEMMIQTLRARSVNKGIAKELRNYGIKN